MGREAMAAGKGARWVGDLPAETTSLVGRHSDVENVMRALRLSRLVTLTGVGGVGKSRLALRAAAGLREEFPDGAWWVQLSPLSEPTLLGQAISEALGLADQTVRPATEVLADYLAGRELLLTLDTCEHLAEEAAVIAAALLRAAPGLRILATSRRLLDAPGEHVVMVDPLPVPGPGAAGSGRDDAVALFAERAASVSPGFKISPQNETAVVALCRQLDGLPLAIELAAARLPETSPDQIVERLGGRFALLADAAPTPAAPAPVARHQTLRAAIGWSHELCEPLERLAWARLSVFAGGFGVAAAEQVCADSWLPDAEVLPLLMGLVDKSIVTRVDSPNTPYRMLDTIRAYGADWLRDLGEELVFRRRHRDCYLALARHGSAGWLGPGQFAWYDRMTAAHGNLRAALDFCLAEPDGHTALDLAGSLWFFWYACGHAKEGRHYLERALAQDQSPCPERTRALWACSLVAATQGDGRAAAVRAAEGAEAADRQGDADSAALARAAGAAATLLLGDPVAAAAKAGRVLATRGHDGGLDFATLVAQSALAHVRTLNGQFEDAIALLDAMRSACDEHGELWMRSLSDWFRARAELLHGRLHAAQTYGRAALTVKHRLHDSQGVALAVDLLAATACDGGQGERAARLLGLGQQVWSSHGLPQIGLAELVAARQACEEGARGAIGDHAYDEAFRAGYESSLDAGIEYAMSDG
jgi:predicted ATPase